jgi:hypothetical protein
VKRSRNFLAYLWDCVTEKKAKMGGGGGERESILGTTIYKKGGLGRIGRRESHHCTGSAPPLLLSLIGDIHMSIAASKSSADLSKGEPRKYQKHDEDLFFTYSKSRICLKRLATSPSHMSVSPALHGPCPLGCSGFDFY